MVVEKSKRFRLLAVNGGRREKEKVRNDLDELEKHRTGYEHNGRRRL